MIDDMNMLIQSKIYQFYKYLRQTNSCLHMRSKENFHTSKEKEGMNWLELFNCYE
jgi:hypothetical protein